MSQLVPLAEKENMNLCRICHSQLGAPLLTYRNMPKYAQFLPDAPTDKGVDLVICQCPGCGTVQLTNKPVPYHREVIRSSSVSPEMVKFRLWQFNEFIDRHDLADKKVLEIGCGKGEFMSLMNLCGVRPHGIEYSLESALACMDKGLRVFKDYPEFDDWKASEWPYDAFYCLNFMEHMPNPNQVLRGIRNSLTPGGVGLVEVPNFDMILKSNMFSEFVTDHLFYFTADSLNNLLRLNGFDVLSTKSVWHDYIISSEVRKRPPVDVSYFDAARKSVTDSLHEFLVKYSTVAIWGAGHQALTIIAMSCIKTNIKYVVDSAPFKQGKFTPATHIPIRPPQALKDDPVEAIIVMAAAYSDEVAGIIKRDYPGMKVAILRDWGLET